MIFVLHFFLEVIKMKSQKIEGIRKQFHREWLLIAIDKMDDTTTTPLTGNLLAHSPHRDEIYREEMRHRGNILTVYSEDDFPEDTVAAFYETR